MRRRVPADDKSIPLPFRLGPYELTELLGRGGMGEVYRARDKRLDRTVAVKLLSPALSDNPAARTRFDREARAIASLNHPHVCVVHDVGDDGTRQFIVMECIDGEPLSARLQLGPLPHEDVLQRGIEIAEGLDHAHALGIVHRDVKPSNIMLTRAGAKLVDFGLAALRQSIFEEDTAEVGAITRPGQLLGTLQYMSPEQLEGKESDWRTDLFGCGLVLYEMATGRRAFDGPSSAAIIVAIRTAPAPSIRQIEPTYSADLDWAIRRCLAKSPQDRWQSAGDLAAVLRWIQTKGHPEEERSAGSRGAARRWLWPVVAASVALATMLGTWAVARRQPASSPTVVTRATIRPVAGAGVADPSLPAVALSPDGTRLAYVALVKGTAGLYVRRMDQLDSTLIPGTEGAWSPFFSPDGAAIGFFAAGKLKKVALDGSAPVTLADAPRGRGGSWVTPDTIVFAPSTDTPLFRVRAAGGDADAVTTLGERPHERSHRWPEVLPGGRAVLFTTGNPTDTTLSDAQIVVQPLAGGGERRVLIEGAAYARYAQGHLIYVRGGSLMAVPFDIDRLQLAGSAAPVVDSVMRSAYVGSAQFAGAGDTLVYLPDAGGDKFLAWIDRSGTITRIGDVKAAFLEPRLSPDGNRIAVTLDDARADVGVWDLATMTLRRITHSAEFEGNPVWSADGSRLVFASERGPAVQMFWKRWDDPRGDPGALVPSVAAHQPLAAGEFARVPNDWSPDGRFIAFTENRPDTRRDIWIAPVDGGAPYAFVASPFNDNEPVFSPDGKWLAYQSNDIGTDAIYVQPLAKGGTRTEVARAALTPRWSRSGELFYWKGGKIYAAAISTSDTSVKIAAAKPLFDISPRPSYDVTPDGRRLLVALRSGPEKAPEFVLLHGWRAALQR